MKNTKNDENSEAAKAPNSIALQKLGARIIRTFGSGDQKLELCEYGAGLRAFATNGDPIFEENDPQKFAEVLANLEIGATDAGIEAMQFQPSEAPKAAATRATREPRYTIREPGCCYWSQARTRRQAERDLRQAQDAGLHRAMIVDSKEESRRSEGGAS